MLVTISTLIKQGFKLELDDESTINTLVENHERDYIDFVLSVPLSIKLTTDTMEDERFTALINEGIVNDERVRGLLWGANNYIYTKFIEDKYNNLSDSGYTIPIKANTEQVDPNPAYRAAHNNAVDSMIETKTYILENIESYSEYVDNYEYIKKRGFSHISPFN